MTHALVEIPQTEWPELRDLYTGKNKFSCAYNTIQCLIEWKEQNDEFDINFFSLDGDWRRDGTYVAISKGNLNNIFINTLSDNHERLLTALNQLNNERNLLFGFPERLLPTVEKYMLDFGLRKEDIKTDGTTWFHIDKERAEHFEINIPEGFTLRRLDVKHAEQVNSVWPHRAPGSVTFVQWMIKYNDSVGVFDVVDNLVAWSLRLPIGSLGLVQVVDTHKRMGLGSLVVRAISKLIASKGLEVTAPVVFGNVPSESMFKKLGFKPIDKVYWSMVPERK